MKLSRSILETRENFEKALSLIRTFFNQGGWHIQFNIVNADDLLDAKRNPEKWRSLIVRVAGYSAYFVDFRSLTALLCLYDRYVFYVFGRATACFRETAPRTAHIEEPRSSYDGRKGRDLGKGAQEPGSWPRFEC